MKITPQFIGSFETRLQTQIVSSWSGYSEHTEWDKVMGTKNSSGLLEKYFHLIENASLDELGDGGSITYQDVSAASMDIRNSVSGSALRLSRWEIEDNQMAGANLRGMPALDYAASRAREWGKLAAYRPQELFVKLLADGTTKKGYDNVAFFHASHPVDGVDAGSGVYSNLIASKPIDVSVTLDVAMTNFAAAVAAVHSYVGPNGKPRFLKVRYAFVGPALQKRINEILDAKFYGSGDGATENVLTKYQIEPVVMAELGNTTLFADAATSYYLFCEPRDDEAAMYWQERNPYEMTSYAPQTQVQLGQMQSFEWQFIGRNAAAYGLPYLCAKVKQGA